MKIEYKKLSLIHLNPENPRLIKDGKFTKLCESIKNFPRMLELRPIIVDDLGEILAGNQRYRACKELGIKEVPVLLASDLTDEQKQEFIVKDNISSGEWDWNMLSTQFDSDMLEDWGLDVFPED
jgi:ParB-like chromosome segregation protein Spo0J